MAHLAVLSRPTFPLGPGSAGRREGTSGACAPLPLLPTPAIGHPPPAAPLRGRPLPQSLLLDALPGGYADGAHGV